jgi:hypothetical protein
MFVATPQNNVIALNAKTGVELWRYVKKYPEGLFQLHPTNRGVALDAGRIAWKGRRSVHLYCYPTRWPRDDTLFDHRESFAIRDVIVGPDYGHAGQTHSETTGGSPYGGTTIAGVDRSRQPTDNEAQGLGIKAGKSPRPQTNFTAN